MTRLRAELVCEASLVRVAAELNLGKWLRLGKGEEQGGGRNRPSILADAVEALLAAIYLDGGEERARDYVEKYVLAPLTRKSISRPETISLPCRSWCRETGKRLRSTD
jgi:ribonuclease-3